MHFPWNLVQACEERALKRLGVLHEGDADTIGLSASLSKQHADCSPNRIDFEGYLPPCSVFGSP